MAPTVNGEEVLPGGLRGNRHALRQELAYGIIDIDVRAERHREIDDLFRPLQSPQNGGVEIFHLNGDGFRRLHLSGRAQDKGAGHGIGGSKVVLLRDCAKG